MKKVVFSALLACVLIPTNAYAHVVLQDSKAKMGAVLHVTPDDDPIAGEQSSMAFDLQDQTATNNNYSFTLQISDATGSDQIIPFVVNGTVISANYIFPTQGLYIVKLIADPIDTSKPSLVFSHNQNVSRGLAATSSPPSSHPAAEIGLVSGSVALLVLAIVFWSNRSEMQRVHQK